MKRADDFEERRKHIADLSDEELYNRFWELTAQVVDPLLELALPLVPAALGASAGAALLRAGVGRVHPRRERALREAERAQSDDRPSVGLRGHVPRQLALLVVLRVPEPLRVELVLPWHSGAERGGRGRGRGCRS